MFFGSSGKTLTSRALSPLVVLGAQTRLPETSSFSLAYLSIYPSDWRLSRSISKSNPPINQLVWLVNEQPLARIISAPPSGSSARIPALAKQVESADHARASTLANKRQPNANGKLANDELFNWRYVPLVQSAIDGTKYKLDGFDLLVMNLTKSDAGDEYACKAINIMGETSSQKVRPEVDCE